MTKDTNNTKEIKRYMGVLTEHFNEKVDLIAEQHGSIMENIHDMRGDIRELKEGQENIKMVQMTHSEQLDNHSRVLSSHSAQFEIIKNDLEIIKSELRQKVDYKDFEVLEKRVLRLEAKVK